MCYGRSCTHFSGLVPGRALAGDDFCFVVSERKLVGACTSIHPRQFIFRGISRPETRAQSASRRLFIILVESRWDRASRSRIARTFARERTIIRGLIFRCCVRRSSSVPTPGFARTHLLGWGSQSATERSVGARAVAMKDVKPRKHRYRESCA